MRSFFYRHLAAIALVAGTLITAGVVRADPPVLPTIVNVGDHVTAGATQLGTTVTVVVGVMFALILVGAAIGWARRGLKAK